MPDEIHESIRSSNPSVMEWLELPDQGNSKGWRKAKGHSGIGMPACAIAAGS